MFIVMWSGEVKLITGYRRVRGDQIELSALEQCQRETPCPAPKKEGNSMAVKLVVKFPKDVFASARPICQFLFFTLDFFFCCSFEVLPQTCTMLFGSIPTGISVLMEACVPNFLNFWKGALMCKFRE